MFLFCLIVGVFFGRKYFKEIKAIALRPQSASLFSSFQFFGNLILKKKKKKRQNAPRSQKSTNPRAHDSGASSLPLVLAFGRYLSFVSTVLRVQAPPRSFVLSSFCPGCSSGWCTTWLVWLKRHGRESFLRSLNHCFFFFLETFYPAG